MLGKPPKLGVSEMHDTNMSYMSSQAGGEVKPPRALVMVTVSVSVEVVVAAMP